MTWVLWASTSNFGGLGRRPEVEKNRRLIVGS